MGLNAPSYVSPAGSYTSTHSIPSTGGTVTINADGYNELHYLEPIAPVAAQTFSFPDNANSQIGQKVRFFSTQIIGAITIIGNGLTFLGAPLTTMIANGNAAFMKIAESTWARIQ